MSDQLDAAVKTLRGYRAVLPHDWRIVLNHLLDQGIVQWPTEPRIISNFPDLRELPVGAIIKGADKRAYQLGHSGWWWVGSALPILNQEIPLPAEVLA